MTNPPKATGRVISSSGKYLTFQLGEESYGLEIMKAQEIIGMMRVTKVPRMPDFVRGVINLRGRVIPVIDLRRKFGLEPKPDTDRTCIIVCQVARDGQQVTVGLIVDEVSEVLDIREDQIDPAPDFGGVVDTSFLLGIGKVGPRVIMLLDADKVFSAAEVAAVAHVRAPGEAQSGTDSAS